MDRDSDETISQGPGLIDHRLQRIDSVRRVRMNVKFPVDVPVFHQSREFPFHREFEDGEDRKSTRLNSSHGYISYAVFCLKKKSYSSRSTAKPLRDSTEAASSNLEH